MPRSHTSHKRPSHIFQLLSRLLYLFWEKGITFLAWLWRFILWIWGIIAGFILAGIAGNAAYKYVTTGQLDHIDLLKLSLVQAMFAHPFRTFASFISILLLTLLSFTAKQIRLHTSRNNEMSEYVLKQVNRLNPKIYIVSYFEQAYLCRRELSGIDADATAGEVLRTVASQSDSSSSQKPMGICIFGRPAEGKTRMAWESMRSTLPTWTFVKWPHIRQYPFHFAALHKKHIVLWLDDLHQFANPNEAPMLNDLPRHFAEIDVRLVVVATCRDSDDEKQARKYLGSLLERLTEIHLGDISLEEAHQLETMLKQQGVEVQGTQFDGTPGSLLLGVNRMRDQRYPNLPESAQSILKAMKLLHSAHIYTYPASRVRTIAVDLFNLNQKNWRDAYNVLVRESFIRLGAIPSGSERFIEPVADVYLEQAIPDYPTYGADITDDWAQLQESLIKQQDAAALNSLGIAFSDRLLGEFYINKRCAEACFRAALQIYTQEDSSDDWAATQNNLGIVLSDQSDLVEGKARVDLLKQAVEAYRAALQVYTRERVPAYWAGVQNNLSIALRNLARLTKEIDGPDLLKQAADINRIMLTDRTREQVPNDWARTQNNLGIVLSDQAEFAEGEIRTTLLKQAVEAFRAALQVYTQVHTAAYWAGTQNNLGVALYAQAQLASGYECTNLLKQAVEAYCAALTIRNPEKTPADWARTQNNLGVALYAQAELAKGITRTNLLKQAVEAYHAALLVYTRKHTPVDWALTMDNLGDALRTQAELVEGTARTDLLKQAVETYQAVLWVYSKEYTPIPWARIQSNLGNAFRDLARVEGTVQVNLLKQAVEAYHAALQVYIWEYSQANWAKLQINLAQSQLTIASLEENAVVKCGILKEAHQCTKHLLSDLTPETALIYYYQATELRTIIEEVTRLNGCTLV